MTFTAVPNWWGTPKPTVKTINIDIKDPSTAPTTVDAFFQKGYDIIGYGGDSALIPLANVLAIQNNSREKPDLLVQPKGRTTWLSFNIGYPTTGGPFLGYGTTATNLRLAFDLAVDKQGLATTVCHNVDLDIGLIFAGDERDPAEALALNLVAHREAERVPVEAEGSVGIVDENVHAAERNGHGTDTRPVRRQMLLRNCSLARAHWS